ncbi:MAG: trypsin-like peptidase domain-containing protein [Kiritimatiellae bacterium]|nr:trypsin-like peptidase domain-containing protein [Kiritimatiellia bacterium]
MKQATITAALLGAALATTATTASAQEDVMEQQGPDPLNAVVKLEVSTSEINELEPWRTDQGGGDGSGVIIGDGRILTCAHCVSDAAFIRVRKSDVDTIYHGKVEFIDNDCDLALVRVEDPSFMANVAPMEIGETPRVQAEVVAVGYPRGGRLISFTRGIVSRIEDQRYSQSFQFLLAIQIDAAINPGNSGGPVLDMGTGEICGIAFQGRDDGESLGYMIPPDMIRQFFNDIADGRIDGVAERRFSISGMESEARRRACGMKPEHTGVFITNVDPSIEDDSVKTGDILLEIGGFNIANNGNIRIEGNEIRSVFWPLYIRQIGETIPAKVLRKGVETDVSLHVSKRNWKVRPYLHDLEPDWFITGGFVFTTSSFNLLEKRAHYREDPADEQSSPGEMQVILCSVFADAAIEGYMGSAGLRLDTVNGVKVRNLRHLAELVDGCGDEFIRFGMDDDDPWNEEIIVDRAQMREATPRVMERYKIPFDRSEDLRAAKKP